MNSTAMSHPGPRLLASLPHPIPALKVRGLHLQFLTLELGKKVGDDTTNIKQESYSLSQGKFPKYATNAHKSMEGRFR